MPEQEPTILAFEGFSGLNTDAARPALEDSEMFICDGFMPVGKSQLRTMPDVGASIFTAGGGSTVAFFEFGNVQAVPLMIVVQKNGAVYSVNMTTFVSTLIAAAGTLLVTDLTQVGVSQWGSQFVILAANQENGYFLFDGTLFYAAGGIAPVTSSLILSGGSGYTSPPSYTVYGGAGSGVTLTTVLTTGTVTGINITASGTGYLPGDVVAVAFNGGGADTAPILQATVAGGVVSQLTKVASGSGHSAGSHALAFSGGGGSGAAGTFFVVGGAVTTLSLDAGGSGYVSAPAVSFASGGGTGSTAVAALTPGAVTSIVVTAGGTNLSGTPSLLILGGGGSGARAVATVTAGAISSVSVTAGGTGYTSLPTIQVQSGMNTAATAVLAVMPFGVQGTTVETYQSRVFLANGSKVSYSAPQSVTDFSSADGGGYFASNDSFLRRAYIHLRQSNGFLYLIADSSVNYIGGISTSGSPPTTSFVNQNADPEVGTPYPASIDAIGSSIILANAFGVHVSYGGKVTKVSNALDGIYNTVPNFGGLQLSACKAIVYGKKIWMALVPVVDQVSGATVNKLFCWDPVGDLKHVRWWTTQQSVALTFVQHQEIESVLTAYGTDGNSIYPLFQTPSAAFTKTVQSKLWARPHGYDTVKAIDRVWMLAKYSSVVSPSFTLKLDNETGVSSSLVVTPPASGLTTGLYVMPPTAMAQAGALLGFTLSTNAADMTVISISAGPKVVQYRG